MRTLLVVEKTSSFGYLIHEHVRALREAGHDVKVCFLIGPAVEDHARAVAPTPVRFEQLPSNAVRGTRIKGALHLLKVIREEDPELVISEQYSAVVCATIALALSRKKFRNVAILHGPTPGKASIRRIFFRTLGKLIDVFVLVSRTQMLKFRQHNPHIPEGRIKVISNIINAEHMTPQLITREAAREQLGLNGDDMIFGFVGRFNVKKGIYELISAFESLAKENPKYKLVLIGFGPEEEALKARIEQSSARSQIHLIGKINEAWRYMRAFDIFVFPSWAESFGMVLVEAMQASVPVIACDDGVMPDVLGDAALALPPIRDESALLTALSKAAHLAPEMREQLISRGLDRVHTVFSYARMAKDMQELTKMLR